MNPSKNSQDSNDEFDDRLQASIRQIVSAPIDSAAIDRVKSRAKMLNAELSIGQQSESKVSRPIIDASAGSSGGTTIVTLRKQYRSLLMKSLLATAVIAILVVSTFMTSHTPPVYAQVFDQIQNARTCVYVTKLYTETSKTPIVTKTYIAEDGSQRSEHAVGGIVTIFDKDHQIRLTLIPMTKTALRQPKRERPNALSLPSKVEWLEKLKAHGNQPDEKLGKSTIDGRVVEGFVVKQASTAYTIWVDDNTKALVQIEHKPSIKGMNIAKTVMSDFQFNEKLDDSLFSTDVPEGYSVQESMQTPRVAGGETSIVESLRAYTKHSGGEFPSSLLAPNEWVFLYGRLGPDGKAHPDNAQIVAHHATIIPFLSRFPKEAYEYFGKGKKLTDERCIVFWYRNKDGKLRAIYNDLSVADVRDEDLPKQQ